MFEDDRQGTMKSEWIDQFLVWFADAINLHRKWVCPFDGTRRMLARQLTQCDSYIVMNIMDCWQGIITFAYTLESHTNRKCFKLKLKHWKRTIFGLCNYVHSAVVGLFRFKTYNIHKVHSTKLDRMHCNGLKCFCRKENHFASIFHTLHKYSHKRQNHLPPKMLNIS